MNPVAWITGAGGLIGGYLARTAPRWSPKWDILPLTRSIVDLTDEQAVRSLWRSRTPGLVVHCAALSRTADCERDPALAHRVNVQATSVLAALAADIPFVYFSSDQVFDGTKSWYVETDALNPVNVYGRTKAEAERIVGKNPRHTIVRVALTAGRSPTEDRSFVEDMRRTVGRQHLTLFTDEYRTPIPAGAVARAIWELVGRDIPGLYNLGGTERLSRLEIGEALARWYPEFENRIEPGSVMNYTGPKRPADLSMRCEKVQRLLSFPLPGLREWVAREINDRIDPWDYS